MSAALAGAFAPAPPRAHRLADGKRWTVENLDVATPGSYCYEDSEANCRRYGRLYTWQAAQGACRAFGKGWRLPSDDEWRRMAKLYGGVSQDSATRGKDAYRALIAGGPSGFHALLGGGRSEDGRYARLEAHGFYWTASEDAGGAWYYNFGAGGQAFHRQSGGGKVSAFSVRCISD